MARQQDSDKIVTGKRMNQNNVHKINDGLAKQRVRMTNDDEMRDNPVLVTIF